MLGIIGVVASMTIPTLIKDHQKQVLKTQFKKSYTNLSQAVEQMKVDYGSDLSYCWMWENNSYVNRAECTGYLYKKLRKLDNKSVGYYIQNFNKTNTYYGNAIYPPMTRLPDGSTVFITVNHSSIEFIVDTNGIKPPNRAGYDVFDFEVSSRSKSTLRTYKQSYVADISDEDLEQNPTGTIRAKGDPCNKTSKQTGNGIGCGWYALMNVSPEDKTKTYWEDFLD